MENGIWKIYISLYIELIIGIAKHDYQNKI